MGGGVKALVAGPLKKTVFCGFPYELHMIARCNKTSNDFLNSYLFWLILTLSLQLIKTEDKAEIVKAKIERNCV